MKRLAVLLLVASPLLGQAQKTSSAACRLDGGAGCTPLTSSTGVSTALDLITSTRGSIFYRGTSSGTLDKQMDLTGVYPSAQLARWVYTDTTHGNLVGTFAASDVISYGCMVY